MMNAELLAAWDRLNNAIKAVLVAQPSGMSVAGYWFALLKTIRKGLLHRVMCWAGDSEALARATALEQAEKHAKEVLAKSPEHRAVIEQIVQAQLRDLAKKDNLISLLDGSLKS